MDRRACDAVIKSLTSQELDHAAFTDGGAAAGNIAFTTGKIPGNSLVVGWKAYITEAFACTSTCLATVGPTGDKDAWTASDPSVAAVGYVGSGSDFTDPDCYVAVPTIPYVEVTEDDDYGHVTTGKMYVTVYYIPLG